MSDENAKPMAPKALFEDAVQGLDHATGNRLRLARRAALAGGPGAARRRGLAPLLATAGVLALGLAWWSAQRGGEDSPASAPAPVAAVDVDVEELPVVAEEGEDAELYAWLAEAPVAADEQGKEQRL